MPDVPELTVGSWWKKSNDRWGWIYARIYDVKTYSSRRVCEVWFEFWDRTNRNPIQKTWAHERNFVRNWIPCSVEEIPSDWGQYQPQVQPIQPPALPSQRPMYSVNECTDWSWAEASSYIRRVTKVEGRFVLKPERKKTGFGLFLEKHKL